MGSMAERAQIVVKGVVQGVGFRPFVFNLAEAMGLTGYVTNTGEGVLVEVEGRDIPVFVQRLRREAPPLSHITDLALTSLPVHGYSDFTIRASLDRSGSRPFTLVSPDISLCADCLKEMLDPGDRRYLYPFINCTNCGPRFSITRAVPYDRPNTTMASFTMCPACEREYRDPRNRRFHAQPNACPDCGPAVELRVRSAECGVRNAECGMRNAECGMRNAECGMRNAECGVKGSAAMTGAIALLKQGGIVAIKGIGGFHLACDASNESAVRRLREKKRKSNKPFAVMAPSIEAAAGFSTITDDEKMLLLSDRRPIVLVSKRGGAALSESVSPNNRFIGVMLPYTPLHYLLFYHPTDGNPPRSPFGKGGGASPHFAALVMTSGNLAEEPIVCDNDEALKKLGPLVDGFLLHDRDIFMRVDDSVLRVRSAECGVRNEKKTRVAPVVSFIRRSRGYAPEVIELQDEGPEVLGCGADLKNTFTITKGKFAVPGQHIGDMENYETVKFFEESLENLKSVYRADPKAIVHDLHPGYLSTRWAIECGVRKLAPAFTSGTASAGCAECGVKNFGIQHHYAHIGSVMAEHGLTDKVIGVAFDGTGYGTDGKLWGGEFLIADIDGFERVGQLKYVPLPGGEASIREPWRTAVSILLAADKDKAWEMLEGMGFVQRYGQGMLEQVAKVALSPELSPLASGAGRLFDAVSALLGVCDRNTFEGEAAMALEALAVEGIEDEYAVELVTQNGYTVIDFAPAVKALAGDKRSLVPPAIISSKFHNTVEKAIRTMVLGLRDRYNIHDVALSGGTFQNLYLLNRTARRLSQEGMRVHVNQKVPCNDGGISLGQAYLIRERLKKRAF